MLSKITKEFTFFKQQPYNMQILLLTNMFYAFVLPVVEIFVGAYIMRNTNNPSYVALYQLAMYVGIVVASVINGELLKRFQVKHLYAFGILVSGLSMVVMMGLKTMGFGELFVAGLFMGIASGFFWANRYLLALNSTNDANRNYFFGLESFFFSVCSIIVPSWGRGIFGMGCRTSLERYRNRYEWCLPYCYAVCICHHGYCMYNSIPWLFS